MASPISVSIPYPEKLSRGLIVLKGLFGYFYVMIPHGIVIGLYGIAVAIVSFIAFWVILFTGKYPKGMYDFALGYARWNVRVYLEMG